MPLHNKHKRLHENSILEQDIHKTLLLYKKKVCYLNAPTVVFSKKMCTLINIQILKNVYIMQRPKRRKQELIQHAAKNVKFMVGQEKISRKKTFKYLGRIINDSDDNLPAVEIQQKARQVWAKISKFLRKKQIATLKLCLVFINL
jgi:hypothetical protein